MIREQLWLLRLDFSHLYFKEGCGTIKGPLEKHEGDCYHLSSLMAIFFRMGCYTEDDKVPREWIGLDCPFDDSPYIFGCCLEHLENLIKNSRYYEDWGRPDIVVNKFGKMQERFSNPETPYSFGRETLSDLWEREKGR